jgi:hypothetical protein
MGEGPDALFYTLRVPQLANAEPMLDFVGINVYRPIAYELASDEFPGGREPPFARGQPKMSSSWRRAPKFVQSQWKSKEMRERDRRPC